MPMSWSRPSPISAKTILSPKEARPRATNVKLDPGRLGIIDSARTLSITWFALDTEAHGILEKKYKLANNCFLLQFPDGSISPCCQQANMAPRCRNSIPMWGKARLATNTLVLDFTDACHQVGVVHIDGKKHVWSEAFSNIATSSSSPSHFPVDVAFCAELPQYPPSQRNMYRQTLRMQHCLIST